MKTILNKMRASGLSALKSFFFRCLAAFAVIFPTLLSIHVCAQSVGAKHIETIELKGNVAKPTIDGSINEAVWDLAEPVSNFHQVKPREFSEPSERTEIKILYDEDNIYIAAKLFDSDISNLSHGQVADRKPLDFDDQLSITIDSFSNKRNGYLFQVNPNGSKFDSLITNTLYNPNWNTLWIARSSIKQDRWEVEIVIPFKSISFDPRLSEWGINFARFIPRRKEVIAWSSRGQSTWEMIPAVAGSWGPVDDFDRGSGIDVTPSLVEIFAQHDQHQDSHLQPSLDVLYKPIPSMNILATFRPDFSYAELDDALINLSRFGVLLPEKRDFFLQDSNIFDFGGIEDNGLPFISRKFGLGKDGQPLIINSGLKLTGREEIFNYGLMNISQRAPGGRDINAQVARTTVDIFDESSMGVILTHGDPMAEGAAQTVGADFKFRDSQLPIGAAFETNAWYLSSERDYRSEKSTRGNAFGGDVALNFSSDAFKIGFYQLDENYDPALGFVNRNNMRNSYLKYERSFWVNDSYVKLFKPSIQVSDSDALDGLDSERSVRISPLFFENETGDSVSFFKKLNNDVVSTNFNLLGHIAVPRGSYSDTAIGSEIKTSGTRIFSINVSAESGTIYDLNYQSEKGNLILRVTPRLTLKYDFDVTKIETSSNSRYQVTRALFDFALRSNLVWSSYFQKDTTSKSISKNSRIHWQPSLLQSIYFVVSDSSLNGSSNNPSKSELSATFKWSYLLRY